MSLDKDLDKVLFEQPQESLYSDIVSRAKREADAGNFEDAVLYLYGMNIRGPEGLRAYYNLKDYIIDKAGIPDMEEATRDICDKISSKPDWNADIISYGIDSVSFEIQPEGASKWTIYITIEEKRGSFGDKLRVHAQPGPANTGGSKVKMFELDLNKFDLNNEVTQDYFIDKILYHRFDI